ncbi:PRC-barrel domain-containing protein [Sulfitobacter sp. LCG007]
MNSIMQNTSRLALAALLSAAPVLGFAQATDNTPTQDPATQQIEGQAGAQSGAQDNAAPMPTENGASDSTATADAPAADTETEQSDTAQAPAEPMTPPADGTMTADAPADGTVQDGMATDTAEAETAKPVDGQIIMQDEDTILANNLIGSNVYSADGEDVGEIDNLIISLDGKVEGVVIGVGGFLGLGEKDVAVEMASLSTTTDDMGNIRLVTSATKADFEAAEDFVTTDQVAAESAADPMAAPTAPATE